jgi:hypothetical protein
MTTTVRADGASIVSVFHLSSPERAKRVAKSLADAFKRRGAAGFPYSKCQELVARMYGHRTHQALLADCGKHPVSPDDAVAGATVAAARRALHVSVLTAAGIDVWMAGEMIDAVSPTGRADPRRAGMFADLSEDVRALVRSRRRSQYFRLRASDRSFLTIERSGADLGSSPVTDHLEFQSVTTARNMLFWLRTAEAAGGTMDHLKACYLSDLISAIETSFLEGYPVESSVDLPDMRVAKPLLRAVADRAERLLAGLPTVGDGDDDIWAGATEFVGHADLVYFTFRGEKTVPDAIVAVEGIATAFDKLKQAGASLPELAEWVFCLEGRNYRLEETELGWVTESPAFMALPSTPLPFDPAACDKAVDRALKVAMGRGIPVVMAPGGGFGERYDHESSCVVGGVRLFAVDAVANAAMAGRSFGDLLASLLEAVRILLTAPDLPDDVRAAWSAALNATGRPAGEACRELVAAALTLDLLPTELGRDPAPFFAGFGDLLSLQAGGFGLLDFAAAAHLGYMPEFDYDDDEDEEEEEG